ncbi:MAG: type I pullulanase [Clostridium sp.]|uniref:type I pullulanase n=1 Tax=Clostridium sp. TaxID=1506 RepID=UPI003EE58D4F
MRGVFKRVVSLLLSLSFILLLLPNDFQAKVKDGTEVYIKIRYDREDEKYDGWNFWTWERDEDGKDDNTKVSTFLGEDEEGKFTVLKVNRNTGKLGFILRRSESGNDWTENYFGEDKFISLAEGDKEIVIKHKEENKDFEVKDLNRDFDKVTLNLNYFRFNNDYEDRDIWSWFDGSGKEAMGYSLKEDTSYGKKAIIEYENIKNADKRGIGFIARKSDWSDKDIDTDRFANLAYANNKGEINIYIVQGNSDIFYREKDAVRENKITDAKINKVNEISFSTNVKMTENVSRETIILLEDGEPISFKFTLGSNKTTGTIVTDKSMDLSKEYILKVEGFGERKVGLGKVFETEEFKKLFHYEGELGALYKEGETTFRLWAPMANSVKLALYKTGDYIKDPNAKEVKEMKKLDKGIFEITIKGNLKGTYYDFLVNNDGTENKVTDPYAKAVSVNGRRGMVIDLSKTNPKGWENHKKPVLENPTDAIIYEMHIRDFTIDESSNVGVEVRGKYNGLWQSGKTLPGNNNVKVVVDHLKELGITELHLLPTFDHRSIDETKLQNAQYNWGYDPQNYNVPEGSYSSDPYKAEVRIEEFKKMVMELHKAGIRVVMDVVYNHTGATSDSHLNLAVPDYYYRQNANGGFSNGSGCGNEIASERSMVRKMIIDSLVYWAKEYKIDGFRFDLMGLHDIETMKQIRTELDKVDKSILIYGEGWTGGDSPLPDDQKAIKVNTKKYGDMQIAAFSDDMRDAIKGHVFDEEKPGFINGFNGLEEVIKFGVVASTKHNGVKYGTAPAPYNGYGISPWANQPYQTVNYASAHDNLTLWDKLQTTNKKASKEELEKMNKLSAALVLTSQGIPFFQGGEEMARTKVNKDGSFNENSYNAPDSVNKIDWKRKAEYNDLFNYYKGLIELRKSHKVFRMNSTDDIQKSLKFLEKGKEFKEDNVVAYTLNGEKVNDKWKDIAVVMNANKEEVEITLPSKEWEVVVDGDKAGVTSLKTIKEDKVKVPGQSSYVLVQKDSYEDNEDENNGNDGNDGNNGNNGDEEEDKDEGTLEEDKDESGDKGPVTGDTSVGFYILILVGAIGGLVVLNKGKFKKEVK